MNNSLWVEQKYINLLSSHLEKFKKRGAAWNFRCPLCGDSKTNHNKTRGYIFSVDGTHLYKCHNCGESLPFGNFLQRTNQALYDQYRNELFVNNIGNIDTTANTNWQPPQIETVGRKRHQNFQPLATLKKISQLDQQHPAKQYVLNRKIPAECHWMLYFAPKFNRWINTILPDKLPDNNTEPRLVIPFIDADGYVFGVAGRSFDPKSPLKYITIKFDQSKPKIFGLNTVDWSKPVKIVEGPIDSFMLSNAIAFGGVDGDLSLIDDRENCTIVLDNQPRNSEVVNKMQRFINQGWNIFIWPKNISCKDLNELVIKGKIPVEKLDKLIDNNTYNGLAATAALSEWKRI